MSMQIARINREPEIFYSLQGEGASVGTAAIFLRLAGCNLRCHWCDTKYSWRKEAASEMRDVHAKILSFAPCKRLVITGGEPLLQEKAILDLLGQLEGWQVEIETNGTLWPSEALRGVVSQWNISPKLAHSGELAALKPELLARYAQLPHAWFKFVVQGAEDWPQIAALGLPRERVILMPCATTREQLRARRAALVDLCLREGVRLGDRLHLELWDSKKGV